LTARFQLGGHLLRSGKVVGCANVQAHAFPDSANECPIAAEIKAQSKTREPQWFGNARYRLVLLGILQHARRL